MTPKEKAEELVKTYSNVDNVSIEIISAGIYSEFYPLNKPEAKQCALIAVEEILKSHKELGTEMYEKVGTDSYQDRCLNYDKGQYWQEVKQEIEKL